MKKHIKTRSNIVGKRSQGFLKKMSTKDGRRPFPADEKRKKTTLYLTLQKLLITFFAFIKSM